MSRANLIPYKPLKCPNGCALIPDAYLHRCMKHTKALQDGKPFKCKIKNCHLEHQATDLSGEHQA